MHLIMLLNDGKGFTEVKGCKILSFEDRPTGEQIRNHSDRDILVDFTEQDETFSMETTGMRHIFVMSEDGGKTKRVIRYGKYSKNDKYSQFWLDTL